MPRLHKQTPEEREKYRTGQLNAKGKAICGAKKKNGKPCTATLINPDNGRCRMHGANSRAGIAHHNFIDGRTSRRLPARMVAAYEAAQADPNLLELRNDIALVDARLSDVLSRVDSGEAGSLWKNARDAMAQFQAAGADLAKAKSALAVLNDVLVRGAGDWEAWHEIGDLLDQRRRLIESERKRLTDMHQMIATERVMLLMGALANVIREHVDDKNVLNEISNDFSRILGSGVPTPTDSGRT